MRRALLILALTLGPVCLNGQAAPQNKHPQQAWPTVFAPETEMGFENAKPPSDAVLDALMKSPEVAETDGDDKKPDRESMRKSFQVVPVSLGGSNEEDFIVLGGGDYTGADSHWFWIVRVKQGKGQVLLFTPGLVVEILKRKTNGYYDIRMSWGGNSGTITRIFRYSDPTYKPATEHSQGPQP
jgi:hypothetical protein